MTSHPMVGLEFQGMDGVQRMLGIVATAFDDAAVTLAMQGVIRPTPCPGLSVPCVDAEYTLEEHAKQMFATEGTSQYNNRRWTRYGNEPRYEAYKTGRRAGGKVGTWEGSRNPLSRTLTDKNDPDHIERVGRGVVGMGSAGGIGLEWGSTRWYAKAFDEGGPIQRWDNVEQPARPMRPVDSAELAFRAAKSMQRVLVGRINLARTDSLDSPAGQLIPRVTL